MGKLRRAAETAVAPADAPTNRSRRVVELRPRRPLPFRRGDVAARAPPHRSSRLVEVAAQRASLIAARNTRGNAGNPQTIAPAGNRCRRKTERHRA